VKFCLKCGYEEDSEIHKRDYVWFGHNFVHKNLESTLVEKMADQIAKEIDDKILSDLFYRVPDDHPLGYMIDLGNHYTLRPMKMKSTWTMEVEKPSILPKKFTSTEIDDWEKIFNPHDIALEDEDRSSDLRQIWANEKFKRRHESWFLRLLGAK